MSSGSHLKRNRTTRDFRRLKKQRVLVRQNIKKVKVKKKLSRIETYLI